MSMSSTYTFSACYWSEENITTTIPSERSVDESLSWLLSKINDETCDSSRIDGFGIEKSFRSRENSGHVHEKVAVLKLCAGTNCLIIQLIHFNTIPTSLAKFLNLSSLIFVGMGIKQNVAELRRDYGLQCRNAVELGSLAAASAGHEGCFRTPGTYDLVKMARSARMDPTCVLDVLRKKSCEVAFGEWDASFLSEEQIRHATIDVYATFVVGKKFFMTEYY